MDKEQILALAEEQGAVANLKQHFNVAGDSIVFTPEELEAFFNAVIESYKAELLKEAGEPVAEVNSLRGNTFTSHLLKLQDGKHMLYTSDQVAAAVAKATKPLEDEVKAANSECELFRKNGRIVDANKIVELSTPLAAAQEEIKTVTEQKNQMWFEMQTAQNQLAKAEQRVAEACALQVATETKFHWLDAARVAKEIRSGEWRKFVKEGDQPH